MKTDKANGINPQALQKRLTELNRVIIQLMSAATLDQLAHDAVTFGTQRLGFERLGLYFCNPDDPLKMTGTYGTDANGNICVEYGTIIQMNENDWIFQAAYLRANHVRVTLDADLYQPAAGKNVNHTVGTGWNACAALWNGDQIVGYLFTDNLLHQRVYTDDEGELLAAYGFALGHLATRLRTEETIRQRQAHYRALLEAMPDILFTLNHKGDFLDCHLPASEYLIVPVDRLIGRNICDLVPVELATQTLQALTTACTTKECVTFDYTLPHGEELDYYEARLVAVEDGVVLALVRNTTKRKLLQEQLIAARKMESLGRMAGGIAHDFNNLLTVIQGFTSIAERHVMPEQTKVQRALRQIAEASAKGARVINQLLSFARKQVVEPEILDLNHLLLEMEPVLRQVLKEDIRLEIKRAEQPMPVRIARNQVEQILLSLTANADDAMAGGGQLTISCSALSLDETAAQRYLDVRAGHYVQIEVTDSGPGIDPAILGNIFDPFFTTKQATKHSGLGLAICHGIVQQNGGHIAVQSVPHSGATFQIFLPYVAAQPSITQTTPMVTANQGQETILLVEDDTNVRAITTEGLQEFGYTVLPFAAGVEAIRYAEQAPNAFALLVTDMLMPQMNGKEVTQAIRTIRPHVPVLIVSGYVDELPNDLVDFETVDFLTKPYSLPGLASRIRGLIDQQAMRLAA